MALFWHQLFATGNSKVDNPPELTRQIGIFREHGLGAFRDLLVEVAKSPAMLFWLDNHGNRDGAINENWGRELLELFSLGVGNYSEDDIKEAARAFTGWTIAPKIPRNPYGRFHWRFEYKPENHDHREKTFLGHTGNFNGEDIVDIIVDQPATARFLARHLYRFFVADEPHVSTWNITPPVDPEAIEFLVGAYHESRGDVRSILRSAVQLGVLQGCPVRPGEVPGGTGGGRRAHGGQLSAASSRASTTWRWSAAGRARNCSIRPAWRAGILARNGSIPAC